MLKDKITDLAEKDGDLTVKLPVTSNDELDDVAKKFNIFMDKIKKNIADAANCTLVLTDGCESLSESTSEVNSSMNQ